MADAKPLFTALDICVLQQGVQRLINECDDHISNLSSGEYLVERQSCTQVLIDYYNKCKEHWTKLYHKISSLQHFSPSNCMQA